MRLTKTGAFFGMRCIEVNRMFFHAGLRQEIKACASRQKKRRELYRVVYMSICQNGNAIYVSLSTNVRNVTVIDNMSLRLDYVIKHTIH